MKRRTVLGIIGALPLLLSSKLRGAFGAGKETVPSIIWFNPTAPELDAAMHPLDRINEYCACDDVKWGGYTIWWTGWKSAQVNCYLVGQWIAGTEGAVLNKLQKRFYASYLGAVDGFLAGAYFDIAQRENQIHLVPHNLNNTLELFRQKQVETLHRLVRCLKENA